MSIILLLEDEPLILTLMRCILEPLGHVLLMARTAEDAIREFEEADADIDVLIADVNVPGRSGIEVALELRSLLPKLKVVLTSGYPAELWIERGGNRLDELMCDSVVVLNKPFTSTTFLQVVSRLIGAAPRPAPALAMQAPIGASSIS